MNIKKCTLEPFVVIGLVKENNGMYDTNSALWEELNRKGQSIRHLAKKDDDGDIMGAWGLLSNDKTPFRPTANPLAKTLYMAGLEVEDNAKAPKGFVKWIVPGGDFLYAPVEEQKMSTLGQILLWAKENGLEPNGYPYDFMPPDGGMMYIFLPVKEG